MRYIRGLLILAVVAGALIALLNAARLRLESPWSSGSAVVQPQYRLDSAIDGSLTVFGETIELGPQSTVSGRAALIGDSIYLAGAVNDNLTAVGSTVTLAPETTIIGDALLLADSVTLDGRISGTVYVRASDVAIRSTANIAGPLYVCGNVADARIGATPPLLCDADTLNSRPAWEGSPQTFSALGLQFTLFASLILSGLAALTVALLPRRVSGMAESLRRGPLRLSLFGLTLSLLTLGLSALYLVLLAALPPIGLLLLPVVLVAALVLLGLATSGWTAFALLIGDFLLRGLARASFPPLVSAAAGSAVLAVAWNALLLTPLAGGWPAVVMLFVLYAIGLGTAAATRLGARPLYDSYFVQG